MLMGCPAALVNPVAEEVSRTLPSIPAVVTVAEGVAEELVTANERDIGADNPGMDTCKKGILS